MRPFSAILTEVTDWTDFQKSTCSDVETQYHFMVTYRNHEGGTRRCQWTSVDAVLSRKASPQLTGGDRGRARTRCLEGDDAWFQYLFYPVLIIVTLTYLVLV